MMRMRTKAGFSPAKSGAEATVGNSCSGGVEWELRPGGMLVQKRNAENDGTSVQAANIKVRVKYGAALHEVFVSSQATFGDLKKLLSAQTGLHHQDQKIIFKDKERDSSAYLDLSGVKDRSKLVVVEDPLSQERRYLEMRKTAKIEKAAKAISEISLEVDRFAGQVSALESIVSKGGKVAEKQVLDLTELLMTQLIKLDGIMADGDAKLQRKLQVKRVQKYVETLDMLKIRNTMAATNGVAAANGVRPPTMPPLQRQQSPPVVTTKWETFDLAPKPSSSVSNSHADGVGILGASFVFSSCPRVGLAMGVHALPNHPPPNMWLE